MSETAAPKPDPPADIDAPRESPSSPPAALTPSRRWLPVVPAFYVLCVALFLFGAFRQSAHVNTDLTRTDQRAYLIFAEKVVQSDWLFSGNRNRMPAFPYLIAPLYDADAPREAFFEKAKRLNIVLSLLALHLIGYMFYRSAGLLAAAASVLVLAFTLFIYRAPFVQAEILYYTFMFAGLAAALRLLRNPAAPLALLTGAVFALAQITKASALPAVLLLLFCLAVQAWVARRRSHEKSPGERAPSPRRVLLAAALSLFAFLLLLSPYLLESKRVYGRYFYNVNSTFYMWTDSWAEAKEGTGAHGDRVGWPDMPEEQIPSPAKYFREHTFAQMADRLATGWQALEYYAWNTYGFMKYLLLYVGAALGIGLIDQWRRRSPWPADPAAGLFAAGFLLGYTFLALWISPLGPLVRVFMVVVAPALYFAQIALKNSPTANRGFTLLGWPTCFRHTFNAVVLLCVATEIPAVIMKRVIQIYGGY